MGSSTAAASRAVLPDGWSWSTLGEIADYVNGRAFKEEDWESHGRPIIRIQNLTGTSKTLNRFSKPVDGKYLVEDGDILLSWSATLGVFTYRGEEAILNQHIFNVHPTIHKRFVYHLLDFHVQQLQRRTHGTGMKHITRKPLLREPIIIPPDGEQQRIADALDLMDRTITQTERLAEKFRAVKSGLLHDLLTRGIGDDGSVRSLEKTSGRFVESELGFIPASWSVYSMTELTTKIVDGVHKTPEYMVAGVPFLTVENLTKSRSIDFQSARRIAPSDHELFKKRADPRPGDVLVTKDGTLGVARVVPAGIQEFSIFVSVAMLRPDQTRILPGLIRYFFESAEFSRQLGKQSAGTGLRHIHLEHFKAFKLAVPPLKEQEMILGAADTIEGAIQSEYEYREKLQRIRNGLTSELLTGRVRVKIQTKNRDG